MSDSKKPSSKASPKVVKELPKNAPRGSAAVKGGAQPVGKPRRASPIND